MSCCKGKENKIPKELKEVDKNRKPILKVKDVLVRSILFLVSLLLVPVIAIGSIIILFRMIVLAKNINVLPFVYYVSNKIFKKEEDDDEDEEEDDELNEEDYELENEYDVITLN